MKKDFKFEGKHLGMRCNVPYVYTLTIVGFIPERKLVVVRCSFGQYEQQTFYVPEADITLDPKDDR